MQQAILTDEEVLGIMGEYAVSFSINTAYRGEKYCKCPTLLVFPVLLHQSKRE